MVVSALAAFGIGARAVPCGVDAAEVAALAAARQPGASPPGPLYIHPPAVTAPRPRRAAP